MVLGEGLLYRKGLPAACTFSRVREAAFIWKGSLLANVSCPEADLFACFNRGSGEPLVLRLFLGIVTAMMGFLRDLRIPPDAVVAKEKEKRKSSRVKRIHLNLCLPELRRDWGTDALSEPGDGGFLDRSAPRGLTGLSGALGESDTLILPLSSGKILKNSLPTVQLLGVQACLMNSCVR